MVIAEVEEVILKYRKEEEKVDNILKLGFRKVGGNNTDAETVQGPKLSTDQAKARNRQILKELETVKGNLRSKSIFSPTELQWEKVCGVYQQNPSLPIETWHCHMPVFV
ncbi:uncharacterized protein [Euwallacea similis]|uniref:uncharacterized protein n=1 Tax=Euwallacea similis TaxID=1736056 RepID=UPI00344D9490